MLSCKIIKEESEKNFSENEIKFVRIYTIMLKGPERQHSYWVIFTLCITLNQEELIRIDNSKVSEKKKN